MRVLLSILTALSLSACASVTPQLGEDTAQVQLLDASLPSPKRAADNFLAVVDRVEPIAERICRAEAPALTCDYQIVVDSRPTEPPNAFQTLDRAGRPIIAFTISLIADARNQDELAFILGHEAAHHIAGHLQKTQATAQRGALLAGALAAINGAEEAAIRAAQESGATVGARAFSKEFELEADAMGAVIAYRAGFDPLIGAKYFERIADPGNRFLGTHPPNADRIETVRRTVESLR
jgi:predicted Zn-dependent protease